MASTNNVCLSYTYIWNIHRKMSKTENMPLKTIKETQKNM